ncbi:uncharacterized protein SCHCODRAFT_02485675 [Schizophyllum commune H4-8]|uniref:C2H2-type domain-containing protein n=1 Tax=Schizophyllum commune (strain H4-8 / FGSC 9210) TaxID=578458 RepID=D8PWL6_SCHCM|nr:uncharacterized protein SCHCODRAFT_02485675 [Schizophyllum commune H4-8]KAI5899903.1 hypothetical protein SCHCODRAFT_02485675 [Schizophyllum commune H4-8]
MPRIRPNERYTPNNLPVFVDTICQECGAQVKKTRDQNRHKLGHLPDKYKNIKCRHPCTWPDCGKRFAAKCTLQTHIRAKHTGETPYVCPNEDCGEVFHDGAGLYHHRERHHDYKSPNARGPRAKPTKPAKAVVEKAPKAQRPGHTAAPTISRDVGYAVAASTAVYHTATASTSRKSSRVPELSPSSSFSSFVSPSPFPPSPVDNLFGIDFSDTSFIDELMSSQSSEVDESLFWPPVPAPELPPLDDYTSYSGYEEPLHYGEHH